MIQEKILSKNPITMAQANDILKERLSDKPEKEEISYEQDMSRKYFEKFSKLSPSKAEKLQQDLLKIDGVDEAFAVKTVDLLPQTKEVLQLLLHKNSKISDADLDKILDLVKKYQK
jgi:DNA-directed RNA polymerase subunit F